MTPDKRARWFVWSVAHYFKLDDEEALEAIHKDLVEMFKIIGNERLEAAAIAAWTAAESTRECGCHCAETANSMADVIRALKDA